MTQPILLILKFYKKFLSSILETAFGKACRFTPSCSQYTIEALEKFGTVKGLALGLKRVSKCHPWGGQGYDPVQASENQTTRTTQRLRESETLVF